MKTLKTILKVVFTGLGILVFLILTMWLLFNPIKAVICSISGGTITQAGEMGKQICLHTFSDGGNPCTSSSQCKGGCMKKFGDSLFEEVKGQSYCRYDDNPFGCYATVEQSGAVCID